MCDCIKNTDESLLGYNTALNLALSIKDGVPNRVIISTRKIDAKIRKGPITLVASYCPFCGERYMVKNEQIPSDV